MSLLGSLSRTQSGSPLHSSIMTALCPRLHHNSNSNSNPLDRTRHAHAHAHRRDLHLLSRRPPLHPLTPEAAESLFLDALARASLCRKHARPISYLHRASPTTTTTKTTSSSRTIRFSTQPPRHVPPHTSAVTVSPEEPAESISQPIPREKLRTIVDQYDYTGYGEEQPAAKRPPEPPIKQPVLQPDKIPHRQPLIAQDPHEQSAIDNFILLLEYRDTPNTHLYEAYRNIPSPRAHHLQNKHIRIFMHRLSVVEYKNDHTMQRYLSVVDDLFASEIPLTTFEWNSAISFAGRHLRKVGDIQVDTATQIWLRMEKEGNVGSTAATFSILFDIATKAGKFALADIVVKEMTRRNIEPSRYHRTNRIYHHGLRRDGEAVRAAYKDFVDAGEIIDAVVLNCVIASLIKAGEASAAEHIFHKMRYLSQDSTGVAEIKGWRAERKLGKVLDRAARNLRDLPERREAVQKITPISPNLHTYRMLIKYHAHESGNIDRISELLDEMQHFGIRIHGSIFFQILRGFHFHGGIRYSSWNKNTLDGLWKLFCQHVERDQEVEQKHQDWMSEGERGCYFDVSIVRVALQAYYKVTGKDTTMQVWQEIKELWKPDEQDEEDVNTSLVYLMG
jgi:pentatricopeptide repeat protein